MKTPKMLALGIVVLSALLTSIPASAADVLYFVNYGRYSGSDFRWAASDRDLTVEIRGNPTSAPKDVFDRAITDAMRGQNYGPRTNFTTTPDESARPNYRLVIVFAAHRASDGRHLCRKSERGIPDQSRPGNEIAAAFCYKDEALSETKGRFGSLEPVEGRTYAGLMGMVVRALLPPRNPEHYDKCLGVWCN